MKKILYVIGGIIITAFLIAYSGIPDKYKTQYIANEFVKNFYMVDSKKIAEYNNMFSGSSGAAKFEKGLNAIDKDIRPLMTEKEYRSLVINRLNTINIQGCSQNNCTMEIINLTLTQRFCNKEENKIGYDYEAKVKVTSNSGKKIQTDIGNGYIGFYKENGEWNIYVYEMFSMPKLIKLRY